VTTPDAPTPIKQEEAEDPGNTFTPPNDENYDWDTEVDSYSCLEAEERSPRSSSAADWILYPQASARTPGHGFDSEDEILATTERPTAASTVPSSLPSVDWSLSPHGLARTPGPPFDSEEEILPTTEGPTASPAGALFIIGDPEAVFILRGENADRTRRRGPASTMYRNALSEDISDTDVEDWSQL